MWTELGHGEVLLGDGRVLSTRTDPESVRWREDGEALRLVFRNLEPRAVAVEQLRVLVLKRDVPVEELKIGGLGWQSWSRSYPPAAFEANYEIAGPPIRGPYLPHRSRESQVEPWMALVCEPGAPPLLVGFLQAEQQQGTIEFVPNDDGHTLIAATEPEGISVHVGEELQSEPLLIARGTETELRAHYAEQVAQRMPPRLHDDVLTGWCSWYQLYTTVSEADVRRNMANLVARRDTLPLRLIQLDDGFQHAVGDWLELNDKFDKAGLRGLADEIKRQGFVPGLWLAPFLLSAHSNTYAEHPDWVVRDDNGQPLNALHNWGAANYVLDTTQPAAMQWLLEVVRTAVADWGFEYLKLDFLYAAAMRGRRADDTVTSVEAYRRAMRAIRDVAGERFILGSGAPLLPSIGLVDGMRIGSDVAAYWGRGGNADGPALSNALRATLARMWLHGRWWANDPDCVIVRASDTELSLDEVQAWAAVVALSGGMLFVGDDVSCVEPDRLALLGRLLPPSGTAAETLPPLFNLLPRRLHLRVARPWGDWSVVGIANWSDEPVAARFDAAEFELSGEAWHVFDLWAGEYLGCVRAPLELGLLNSHALRLLAVHADSGRPRVVGSTGHLLGDVMDVANETWDSAARELVVTPSRPCEVVAADSNGVAKRVALTAEVRMRFA